MLKDKIISVSLMNFNQRTRLTRSLCNNSDALSDKKRAKKRLAPHLVAQLDRDLRDESLDEKNQSELDELLQINPIVEFSLTNFSNSKNLAKITNKIGLAQEQKISASQSASSDDISVPDEELDCNSVALVPDSVSETNTFLKRRKVNNVGFSTMNNNFSRERATQSKD